MFARIFDRASITPFFSLSVLAVILVVAAGCARDPETKYQDAMKSALAYKSEKRWDEERISLLAAITAKPREAQAHFELAEVFAQLKRFPQAVEEYEGTLNLQPTHREARLHLAALLLAARQTELAESHVIKLLEQRPEDIEGQILKGNVEAARSKFGAARETLTKVLAREPENLVALASLGDIAVSEGKPQEAEDFFAKALKIEPKNNPIRLALADLYLRQSRTDEAQSILQNLVDESPTNTTLRFFFGELLLARGQGEQAGQQYVEMLRTDPRRYDARDRLYDLYVIQRRKNAALDLTTALEAKFPEDPATDYFRARNAELNGDIEGARKLLLKSLEGLHNFAPAFRRTGLIELQLGYTNEGIEHLNQAVVLNAADVGARLALAHHLFLRREFALAREHVDKLLQIYPRQLGANILRADLALVEGDLASAEKIYNALVTTLPDNPVGHYKLALLEERRNNPAKAIETYKKGLEFDRDVLVALRRMTTLMLATYGPEKTFQEMSALKERSTRSKPEYNTMLGSLLLAKKGWTPEDAKRARSHFTEAIDENPNFLPAYLVLAQLDSAVGDFNSSVLNYRKVIAQQPKQVPGRLLLAMTLERERKLDEAAKEYREILSIAPRFGPAANNLAWILANDLEGDLDEALRLALVAKEEMPRESSVSDTLAWVYHKRGSTRAALPIIEEAVQLARDGETPAAINPEILYHLGVIRDALGDPEGAKAALREALQVGENGFPSKGVAQDILKRLS